MGKKSQILHFKKAQSGFSSYPLKGNLLASLQFIKIFHLMSYYDLIIMIFLFFKDDDEWEVFDEIIKESMKGAKN